MSRSIEIELKFEIMDTTKVHLFVKKLKVIEQTRIVDVYFDTKEADLFKRGIFVRIRNGSKFDIKFNQEDIDKSLDDNVEHTHCDEVSTPLPLTQASMSSTNETLKLLGLTPMSAPTLEDLMQRNKLVESITVDKQRTSYEDGEFHIDIDKVKGLGEYLEIEKMTDEHTNRGDILRKMRERLHGLKLKHVDVGYNELYWSKHNFDLYLQGKYLLLEDREKYRQHSLRP
jgi:adenylate cyclase class IV